MGFRINTNIAAMDAHQKSTLTNRMLDKSLGSLASGLRINSAADDASGMVIADSLRSQANSLGQAVNNANDAIGIIQTADKAMDEQIKILDTIKTKAIQAASDTQNATSRSAIQKDVDRLIEQLDNIAKTTSFNGQTLLNGNYTNKEYQVGAYSNQSVTASIQNTQSYAIGNTSTRDDINQLGNTFSVAAVVDIAKGTETLIISTALTGMDITGLGIGDTIRIDGVGDYTIADLGGTTNSLGVVASGTITLDRGLDKTLTAGSVFKIATTIEANEDLNQIALAAGTLSTSVVLSAADMTGFAQGDQIRITNSDGTSAIATVIVADHAVGADTLSGALTLSGGTTEFSVSTGATMEIVSRQEIGAAFNTADYVQYTVEGIDLRGVQVTDDDGNGVAAEGLGKVADLINATTAETGVKALAVVEKNSAIPVQEGALAADITINGITILTAGTAIRSGDADNVLINAINSLKNETGVSAALETDGTLTLTSDGRAMNILGMSAVAGIGDGVVAGKLQLTKNNLTTIDVIGTHYTDATLSQPNTGITSLTEVEDKHNLEELITGGVDGSDAIGLLRTAEGAMIAMDIVESAITALDTVRADLGSVQNQLVVTVNNISVTAVNVKAAESQIRDVDFAAESANFSKHNILAQSGSYAMSQANAIQQNVLSLLQ